MSLVTFVEDVETLDESVRSLYKEAEGGFILDTESAGGYELDNISGLKSALQKERKSVGDLTKQVGTYKTTYEGLDAEEARAAMTKVAEYDAFDPEKEADKLAEAKFENSKKRWQTQNDKAWEATIKSEYAPAVEQNKVLIGQLRKEMVTSAALKAIAAEDGDAELLLPHVVNSIQFSQLENGQFSTSIVDGQGEVMYNSKGEDMTTQEHVASLKTRFPSAFNSKAISGSGIQSTVGTGAPPQTSFGEALHKLTPGQSLL